MCRRLPGLDGLRAIAVALVFVVHFAPHGDAWSVRNHAVLRGAFGVDIFFVLSGFLITHLLLREEEATGGVSLSRYYERRALRILPPLLLFSAALFAANLAGCVRVPLEDIAAGLSFARNLVGTSSETEHLWTLAIEEQFYLVWPVILIALRAPRRRIGVAAALVALSPFWRHLVIARAGGPGHFNSWRTDLRVEPLAIGSLLALVLHTARGRAFLTDGKLRGTGPALVFSALLVILLSPLVDRPGMRFFASTSQWLCVAALINAVIHDRTALFTAALEWRPIAWFGTLSYGFYLWQQPFTPHVQGMEPTWFRRFPWNLALAFGLAVLSYYAVERPLLSLRQRLRPRVSSVSEPAPAVASDLDLGTAIALQVPAAV